jgi:3',5'-cyclic AMP phosphodiesterase CpdA
MEARDTLRDGLDRRGLLKCAAWAGAGLIWSVQGGLLASRAFGQDNAAKAADFTFVQISDTHFGFNKEPNADPTVTIKEAIKKINALPVAPAFVLHTGDVTHLAKPAQFDQAAEILKGIKANVLYVPGEHDTEGDDTKAFRERYGKDTKGLGWRSFDHQGVHFVGLVNVVSLKANGLGYLGKEQLDWLKADLKAQGDSTPIVVYAHMPLWTIEEKWGWGTDDSAEALKELKRFGSVTVLNGHIHQIMQKVEGNVTFHTARSLAFPQGKPGEVKGPGPLKNVAADKLRSFLGASKVEFVAKKSSLAITDSSLAE